MYKLSSKWGIGPQLKIKINSVDMGVFLNKFNTGQEGLPDPFENLFVFRIFFDLHQGPFDQADGIIKNIEKKAFLVVKILKNGPLGDSEAADHGIDGGPAITLFGKLMNGRVKNSILFFLREVEEGGLNLDEGVGCFHNRPIMTMWS